MICNNITLKRGIAMNYKKIENNNELIKLECIETYKFNDGTSKNVIFAPYLNCNATNEQLNSLLSYYKEIFLNKEIGKMKIIDISISEFNNKKILLFDLQCMHCNRIKRVQNIYNNSFSSCQCQRRRHCDWNIIQYLNKYKSFDDFISSEKFKPFERYYIIDMSAPITENNIFKGTYKDYLKVKKVTEDVPLDKDKYRCRNCGMINDKKDDKGGPYDNRDKEQEALQNVFNALNLLISMDIIQIQVYILGHIMSNVWK